MPEEKYTRGSNEPRRPNEPRGPNEPTTFNILFVCTGNTCRSPLAEVIALREIRTRGWTHVAVKSAGTSAPAGQPASSEAVQVAASCGLDLAPHVTQPLTQELIDWADLIPVMSTSHMAVVTEMGGGEKVALVTDFLEGDAVGASIEDPFGGDEAAYRHTFEQLDTAVSALLSRLEPILSP